jgi:hypothetical protein
MASDDYKNVDKGFGFTIPDGWVKADVKEQSVTIAIDVPNDKFGENVIVRVTEAAEVSNEEFETDAFGKMSKKSLEKSYPDATVKPIERTKVGRQFTWKLSCERKNKKGLRIRQTQWCVLKDHRLYTITWTDTPETSHPKQIDEMIKSFHFAPTKD